MSKPATMPPKAHVALALCAATLLLGALAAPARLAVRDDGFDRLIGRWSCAGAFVTSGKPIASSIAFARDPSTGALIVRHDDTAPNVYHALEIWTAGQGATPFRAAIANSGGMRWFASEGWSGDRIAWSRSEHGAPQERFVYALAPGGGLRVEWWIARGATPFALGDRLQCRRDQAPAAPSAHRRGSGQAPFSRSIRAETQ
jgi:hypothetical protein